MMTALGAALVFLTLTSCSIKVKVREGWDVLHHEPVALGEAAKTWSALKQGRTPSDDEIAAYNRAVLGSVSQASREWAAGRGNGLRIRTAGGERPLTVDSTRIRGITLSEEIVPADYVEVRHGLRQPSAVDGIGTPLVVRKPRSESDPLIPENGLWVPATALLNLDHPGSPVLELIDPTVENRVAFAGTSLPLAANYTAAFARDFRDRQFQFQSIPALLRFEEYADRIGICRVTPFHPDKEPCILIHGINSSPSTWNEVMNRIYADESIRQRYEFWTFGYPTGAPIPYMAAELRQAIAGMLAFRRSNGARDQRITLVGHSMGGLLSKAMTFSSGDAEWDRLFTVPVDRLEVPDEDREVLRRMIYFDAIPEVRRVVFCAVPHRGADIVETPAARLLGGLIQVPTQLLLLSTRILTLSPNALTPEGFEFTRDRLTSLDQLSGKAWTTAEFLNKPLNPGVSYHSLIGNLRAAAVPLEKTGDGVVPYTSAHLEGVASERVVRPAGHAVHRTQQGTAEILRILLLP
ncbi:MAG: alpha/beta fold hydrolase [Verrucomicrobia bacterium]|nr:alpha/beta fold hydrolase [Verrucomicrobiota bacterium]